MFSFVGCSQCFPLWDVLIVSLCGIFSLFPFVGVDSDSHRSGSEVDLGGRATICFTPGVLNENLGDLNRTDLDPFGIMKLLTFQLG